MLLLHQMPAKSKVATLDSFFKKSNTTPTPRSVDTNAIPSAIDLTSDKNQLGCTPTISKALFVSDTTSISAKKDSVVVNAGKQMNGMTNNERLPPTSIVVQVESSTSEGIIHLLSSISYL